MHTQSGTVPSEVEAVVGTGEKVARIFYGTKYRARADCVCLQPDVVVAQVEGYETVRGAVGTCEDG